MDAYSGCGDPGTTAEVSCHSADFNLISLQDRVSSFDLNQFVKVYVQGPSSFARQLEKDQPTITWVSMASDKTTGFEPLKHTERSRHRARREFRQSSDGRAFPRCIEDVESEQHVPALLRGRERAKVVCSAPVGQIHRFSC